ncbi:hypothetical protein D3C84_933690 [compost metagenome]
MPQLEDYAYGMDLDVGKLVDVSPNVRYCGNVRSMMTYEDSKGQLNTLKYSVVGACRNNGG